MLTLLLLLISSHVLFQLHPPPPRDSVPTNSFSYSPPRFPAFPISRPVLPLTSLLHPPPPCPHTSHPCSSLCPSTPAVSLILVPSPPACPYSQLVQYSSLWATVRQIVREGGLYWHWKQHFTGSSAGSTLLQYACAQISQGLWGKVINCTEHVTCGWKSWLKWISATEFSWESEGVRAAGGGGDQTPHRNRGKQTH